jgi:PAS domain-containing protein
MPEKGDIASASAGRAGGDLREVSYFPVGDVLSTLRQLETAEKGFCVIKRPTAAQDARDYRFIQANGQFEQLTGLKAVKGKYLKELNMSREAEWLEFFRMLRRRSEPIHFEHHDREAGRWLYFSGYAVSGRLLIEVSDITGQKRSEEVARESEVRLEGITHLYKLNERMVKAAGLKDILQEILSVAMEITGAGKGNIQLPGNDGRSVEIAVQEGHGDPFLAHFRYDGCPVTSGAAFLLGKRLIFSDITLEPGLQGTEDMNVLLADGIRSLHSTPLVTRNGEVVGCSFDTFSRCSPFH